MQASSEVKCKASSEGQPQEPSQSSSQFPGALPKGCRQITQRSSPRSIHKGQLVGLSCGPQKGVKTSLLESYERSTETFRRLPRFKSYPNRQLIWPSTQHCD